MAEGKPRRRFGNIRRRASGRYQARYPGPDGVLRSAPMTFARRQDAEKYLTLLEAQMVRGEWTDPERGKVRLEDYAQRWITERPGLRPRTIDLYTWLLNQHIRPKLGAIPLGKLDTAMIRGWRAELLSTGVSQTMAAKAYRLLRAVLMTAVDEDRIIPRNPCRIRGAQDERAAERPVLTMGQVFALADAVPRRFRALILVTTFASLRWGEVTALQRQDFVLQDNGGSVRVRQAHTEIKGQGLTLGPPKSAAGRRTVSLPAPLVGAVREHLDSYVADDAEAFVFTGPAGRPLRRGNFNKAVKWSSVTAALGVPGLHFHDLRHTGNTLAAQTPGTTLRDLMARMGHDSVRAAIIYQHATRTADQAIADALGASMPDGLGRRQDEDDDPDDGAAGALVPTG